MKRLNFSYYFFPRIAAFLALLILASCSAQQKKSEENYLVVLSLDGFRWDYVDRAHTPNLDYLAENGVKAERLVSSWPTTTFANHYTLATGLLPHKHGIVANRFYDSEFNEDYNSPDNRASVWDGKFYGGEPIWVSAEKQGLTTASCFWVGSEADVQGIRPTYWKKYDHDMPYSDRIDTVVHWLNLPEEVRPRLVMWYMDEPDSGGHRYGPTNDTLMNLVSGLDSLIGVFLNEIKALPHYAQINFIVVSDHGMMQLSTDKRVYLDEYVDTTLVAYSDGLFPTMNVKAKDGMQDSLAAQLARVPHIRFWKNGEAPAHLESGYHPRFHDFVLLVDDYYSMYWSVEQSRRRDARMVMMGAHGFDNANTDMHGIFFAMGPQFKSDYIRPPFRNLHVYSIMAHVLGIQPAVTDGSLKEVEDLFQQIETK